MDAQVIDSPVFNKRARENRIRWPSTDVDATVHIELASIHCCITGLRMVIEEMDAAAGSARGLNQADNPWRLDHEELRDYLMDNLEKHQQKLAHVIDEHE